MSIVSSNTIMKVMCINVSCLMQIMCGLVILLNIININKWLIIILIQYINKYYSNDNDINNNVILII